MKLKITPSHAPSAHFDGARLSQPQRAPRSRAGREQT